MGQHRINDDGHMRWFDTDEDYYAYMRVRSQFNSAEGYDQARAYFNSDAELFAYLERKHDDGYQQWMSQHGGHRMIPKKSIGNIRYAQMTKYIGLGDGCIKNICTTMIWMYGTNDTWKRKPDTIQMRNTSTI